MFKRLILSLALLTGMFLPVFTHASAAQERQGMCETDSTVPGLCRSYIDADAAEDVPEEIYIKVVQLETPAQARAEATAGAENAKADLGATQIELNELPEESDASTYAWQTDTYYAVVLVGTHGNNVYMIRGVSETEFTGEYLVEVYEMVLSELPEEGELNLDMLPAPEDLTGSYKLESESMTTIEKDDDATPETDERTDRQGKRVKKSGEANSSETSTPEAVSANHPYPGLKVLDVEIDDPRLIVAIQNESDSTYTNFMVQIHCENPDPDRPDYYLILPEIGPGQTLLFENFLPLPDGCGDVTLEFVGD